MSKLVVFLIVLGASHGAFAQAARPPELQMRLTLEGGAAANVAEIKQPLEILSWSWGAIYNPPTQCVEGMPCSKEDTRGRIAMQDLTLVKYRGLDTPRLLALLATGAKIKTATLTVGGNTPTKMVMHDVTLSGLMTSASTGDERVVENLTLTFEELETTVTTTINGKKFSTSSRVGNRPQRAPARSASRSTSDNAKAAMSE